MYCGLTAQSLRPPFFGRDKLCRLQSSRECCSVAFGLLCCLQELSMCVGSLEMDSVYLQLKSSCPGGRANQVFLSTVRPDALCPGSSHSHQNNGPTNREHPP